jgi:hypothetical protein
VPPSAPANVAPEAGATAAAPAPAAAPRAKREVARDSIGERALGAAPDPLQAELERIARLRAAGEDEEADKALDDFRRKHPGYRIPEAMRERLQRR